MKVFKILLILFLVSILFSFYVNNNRYIIKVRNKQFSIKKINDKSDNIAISSLSSLSRKMDKLFNILQKYKRKPEVGRLLRSARDIKLEEVNEIYNNKVAYSINKGEKIGICVRHNNKKVNENLLFFVLLHELAHIMSESYGHTEEFWRNFKYLIKISIQYKLYNYENYNNNPKHMCGTEISSTPFP